jgi:hypothetical protein
MIIESGVQLGSGIQIGNFSVALLVIYAILTSEDGVTQLITEDGDGLVIE